MASTEQPTQPDEITVECEQREGCNERHIAEYHHDGQYGEGRIYIATCPTDGLSLFHTQEADVAWVYTSRPTPTKPTAADLGIVLSEDAR